MRDFLVHCWWAWRWWLSGGQDARTAWVASGVFLSAMREARFRVLW